jgi:hypothetical protein
MRRKRSLSDDCPCENCRHYPDTRTRHLHTLIRRFLSISRERGKRLFAGLVLQWNGKDMGLTATITGLSPRTIKRGLAELEAGGLQPLSRSRRKGGGRKPKGNLGPQPR